MKRELSRVVLICTLALTFASPRVAAAQDARGRVTKEEEAERLTRASFAVRVPATEKLERYLAMLRALPAHEDVSLLADAEEFGYPEGTRLFKVFAPPAYDLLLVVEGGRMKIVWAFVADD